MNVLITAGGTREPIDSVRFIGNSSTGKTALVIAEEFLARDWNVTFVHAIDAKIPKNKELKGKLKCISFETFKNLDRALQNVLKETSFDMIVHAAAVSDFYVDQIVSDKAMDNEDKKISGKLPSDSELKIILKKNPKILSTLKKYSSTKNVKVVGFKLTDTKTEKFRKQAINKILSSDIDYVVHNDLSEISKDEHISQIYKKDNGTFMGSKIFQCKTKKELAVNLESIGRSVL